MKPVVCFLFIALCCAGSGRAQDTIRLLPYVSHLRTVSVTINGKDYRFLFDTGGGETFLSPEVARAAGLTPVGQATTFRMTGEPVHYAPGGPLRLRVGHSDLSLEGAGIWDVMAVLPKGLPQLDGVLSLDAFAGQLLTIDLARDRLVLETGKSAKKQRGRMRPLPARFATGMSGRELTLFLQVHRGPGSWWLLFDSGNLDGLLLAPASARGWGLRADSTQRTEHGEQEFELAGIPLRAETASKPLIFDGALNYAVLRERLFFIDFRKRLAWCR